MKDLQRKKSIKFDTFTDKFKGDGSILIRKINDLVAMRKQRGHTQEEMSWACGVSTSTIKRFEAMQVDSITLYFNYKNVFLLLLMIVCSCSKKYEYQKEVEPLPQHPTLDNIINVIAIIETNNDSTAIGDNGKSFGALQIQAGCVQDVNESYASAYSHSDAFNPYHARNIARLYLSKGIERYQKIYGKYPADVEIAMMWNGGIYNWEKKNKIKNYAKKFVIQTFKTKFDSLTILTNKHGSIKRPIH
jgi:DNA-binding XRE family transcriptional regulator